MQIKALKDCEIKKGTEVLLRTSLNVPVEDGKFTNIFRIEKSIETIKYLSQLGARVVLIAHLGREGESLRSVHLELKKFIDHRFVEDITGDSAVSEREKLSDGEILLLENIRRDKREKNCSREFAKELIGNAKVYIFDSFDVSHRENTSVVEIPKLIQTCAGLQFEKEIEALRKMYSPEKPSLMIIGGAKSETKVPLVGRALKRYGKVFVGGVIANTILSANGLNIGMSKSGDTKHVKDFVSAENLIVPVDVVVENNGKSRIVSVDSVGNQDTIVDIGPKSIEIISQILTKAKNVVWNGPLGWYERGYIENSIELSDRITKTDAFCVVGGGDSVALLNKNGKLKNWDFVSTGGGAMIHYLTNGTLPFLESLSSKEN